MSISSVSRRRMVVEHDEGTWQKQATLATVTGLLLLACWWFWPASVMRVPAERQYLLDAMLTACSTEKVDWLDKVAAEVEQHPARSQAPTEFAAYDAILKESRAGEWKKASLRCRELMRAQLGR